MAISDDSDDDDHKEDDVDWDGHDDTEVEENGRPGINNVMEYIVPVTKDEKFAKPPVVILPRTSEGLQGN